MAITTIPGASSSDLTTLKGTELIDSFTLDSNDVYVDGLEGNDIVSSSTAVENATIETGADNDTVTLSAEALKSNVKLGTGNDKITVSDFTGSIYGGSGQDSVIASSNRTITNSLIRGDGGADDFDFINLSGTIVNVNADDDNVAVTGTTTNSTVYGGRQRDTITISGKATNSVIRGDANEDNITISGELSGAIINGNASGDQISVSSSTIANSTVYGGKGIDTIDITGDAIYVAAGKGNDDVNLTGDEKHTVYGGSGNDSVNSDSNEVLFIDGGADDDELTVTIGATNSGVHTLNGGSGDDSITGSAGIELLEGGTEGGDDTITSGGGNDSIYGRAGEDLIKLNAAGTVVVQGGADDDTVELELGDLTFEDTIKGDDGSDTIAVVGTPANFDMSAANTTAEKAFDGISSIETLAFGGSSAYNLAGNTRTITLSTKAQTAGITSITAKDATGTAGAVLKVFANTFTSSTNLTITGSDDGDVNVSVKGGSGNDTLISGAIGTGAGDTLFGGDGVDTFKVVMTSFDVEIDDLGSGGAETLIVSSTASGVNADVTADYVAPSTTANSKSLEDVKLTAASGIDINMFSAGGNFGYHLVAGGALASTLQGSTFNDSIYGNAGDDSLGGAAGNDTLDGAAGADTFKPGAGDSQILDAGDGNDTIIYDSGTSLDIQNTGTGSVTLTASTAGATVTATGGARTVDASTSTVAVNFDGSSGGANTLTYTGGSGDDTITTDGGADVIDGGSGADTITGEAGKDAITVGEGIDFVKLHSNLEADQDTIADFADSGVDVMGLLAASTTGGAAAGAAAVFTDDTVTGVNNAAYDLSALIDTGATDIAELDGGDTTLATLAADDNGTELLKYLGSTAAATQITVDTAGDELYILAYDDGKGYLYHADSGNNTAIVGGEATVVAVFNGTADGVLTAANFSMI